MREIKKLIAAFFDRRFLRFCLVGAFNTLVGAGIMFGLYNLAGCSYWLSSAANYILTSIISFFLNKHYTFRASGDGWRQALRFAANIAACYVIAYALAKPLVYRLLAGASVSLRDNVAMLTGMVIFTGLNYLGQRFFAFKQSGNPGEGENVKS